ncbi:Cellulose synthase-like protein G3 [Morella rubra]|uniref:Cellulose synthase-like protein G3 n=1 Tax=Morella rubra TaxID=262757 RepID=A0A6A1UMI2_9ROSI|nr:Cellulose synthase-like protein G3 [Morella rubra]
MLQDKSAAEMDIKVSGHISNNWLRRIGPAQAEWRPKIMYENMKARVETVLEKGKVQEEYITEEIERRILSKWTDGFTNQDHPAVIEVLLEGSKNRDMVLRCDKGKMPFKTTINSTCLALALYALASLLLRD